MYIYICICIFNDNISLIVPIIRLYYYIADASLDYLCSKSCFCPTLWSSPPIINVSYKGSSPNLAKRTLKKRREEKRREEEERR